MKVAGKNYEIGHGDVVIAAITSCTNTSNPSVMVAAGLVARKARAEGLTPKPWVKTSLAPGSQVVTEYLDKSGLQQDLDAIGFNTVGYGCTTCIGNSGPLDDEIADAIEDNKLVAVSVLSGNRNFEGRISPNVRANYLASPAAGGGLRAARHDEQGHHHGAARQRQGRQAGLPEGHLADQRRRSRDVVQSSLDREQFLSRYGEVFKGRSSGRRSRSTPAARPTAGRDSSTYVQNPPYFEGITMEPKPGRRHHGRAHPGRARRQHHHRPHQPGRHHPQGVPGRRVLHGAPGPAEGLQQLRRAPRQP